MQKKYRIISRTAKIAKENHKKLCAELKDAIAKVEEITKLESLAAIENEHWQKLLFKTEDSVLRAYYDKMFKFKTFRDQLTREK